jgi:hypothetical protein
MTQAATESGVAFVGTWPNDLETSKTLRKRMLDIGMVLRPVGKSIY